jgi:hypothetical protein
MLREIGILISMFIRLGEFFRPGFKDLSFFHNLYILKLIYISHFICRCIPVVGTQEIFL